MSALRAVEPGNPSIRTASGGRFTFLTPRKCDVNIHDIAASLSRICRYTGQLPNPDIHYSVAQHSVLVSRLCPPALAVWGLMHDSAEAYIGDVSSPLKSLLQDYRLIEHKVEQCVWSVFGLKGPLPPAVKVADNKAYEMEARQFYEGIHSGIVPVWHGAARRLFLERAEELGII